MTVAELRDLLALASDEDQEIEMNIDGRILEMRSAGEETFFGYSTFVVYSTRKWSAIVG